jgi:hypothetical protein
MLIGPIMSASAASDHGRMAKIRRTRMDILSSTARP